MTSLFVLSLFSEFFINRRAIVVRYQGQWYFTLFGYKKARVFGMKGYGSPNYRRMREIYERRNKERAERKKAGTPTGEDLKYKHWRDDVVVLPLYPYGPLESFLDEIPTRPPHPPVWMKGAWRDAYYAANLYQLPKVVPTREEIRTKYNPTWLNLDKQVLYKKMALSGYLPVKAGVIKLEKISHLLGTDDRGRDVFARMVYGFRISIAFSLMATTFSYIIGILVGASLGYFGGKFDIIIQRFVEVWSSLPFLYTMMILTTFITSSFWLLIGIMVVFGWMKMTYFIRGEFLREKTKDYVSAAKAVGCSDRVIMFKHILPNTLTPIVSFMSFSIMAKFSTLVSLSFFGFGLPAPTPSWGELLAQGLENLTKPWLILSPVLAMFMTLLLISFIGEAIREAFDPRPCSRLR